MNNKKIGDFIKQLRENEHWSQEKLAEKLYVTRQAVSSWETGKNIPDIDKFESISKLFNVSIAELYAGERLYIMVKFMKPQCSCQLEHKLRLKL